MRRGWLAAAAIAITAGMILPTAAFCQENAAKEDTYEGEAMCRLRRGVFPHPVYRPEPEYDNQARKKKIQGTVFLSTVITKEGRTADIKVVKTLTPGLDQQAIKAVSRWRFEPVTQDGQPCPMRVQVEVSFHLY